MMKNIPSERTKLPRKIKNAKKNPKHSAMPKIAPTSTSIIMLMDLRLYNKAPFLSAKSAESASNLLDSAPFCA